MWHQHTAAAAEALKRAEWEEEVREREDELVRASEELEERERAVAAAQECEGERARLDAEDRRLMALLDKLARCASVSGVCLDVHAMEPAPVPFDACSSLWAFGEHALS